MPAERGKKDKVQVQQTDNTKQEQDKTVTPIHTGKGIVQSEWEKLMGLYGAK